MALSGSTNYTTTRNDIINRALRIIGAVGQGETLNPSSGVYTEAAQALNELLKEWVADGMQLWKIFEDSITLTASTASYTIGIGATVNTVAPTKILQAYLRNTAESTDTPVELITRYEYLMLSNKTSTGFPSQLFYNPPGVVATEMAGTIQIWPTPTTAVATDYTLRTLGMHAMQDFDASTDTADLPNFYYNALCWGLADQLSYEYGLPFAERSMITKKADSHYEKAKGYDREEGSVYLQPDWNWGAWY
jgi:hypothetical protein